MMARGLQSRTGAHRTAQSESDIQRGIVNFVRTVAPQCLTFAIPNASRRTALGFATNGVPGLYPGIQDVCVVAPLGRAHFIEVKTDKGQLRKEQEAVKARMALMGVPHCVARSIDDVREALKAWKIETREVTA